MHQWQIFVPIIVQINEIRSPTDPVERDPPLGSLIHKSIDALIENIQSGNPNPGHIGIQVPIQIRVTPCNPHRITHPHVTYAPTRSVLHERRSFLVDVEKVGLVLVVHDEEVPVPVSVYINPGGLHGN